MAFRELRQRAAAEFQQHHGGGRPRYFEAPGRVNLIGGHTDYNDGFVLPIAIDREVIVAAAARDDRQVSLWSESFEQGSAFDLAHITKDDSAPWSDYVRGVALMLQSEGIALQGMNGVIVGNVPIGSGLSSSAALEVASAVALCSISGVNLDGVQLAKICQRAESEFVGMKCGIMDQLIAVFGHPGSALLIDCRTLDRTLVPLPRGISIVVCDTMKRRGLVESEYNLRRQQCETGVRILSEHLPNVKALRDLTPQELEAHAEKLPRDVLRRCRHVVSENQRVLLADQALRRKKVAEFGRLMDRSDASLRDDYEVSCRELDEMVRLARSAPGCLGARMTGAGFGGCTVNLVRQEQSEAFAATVRESYAQEVGVEPEVYVCEASAGAAEITVP